jgi:hypothetical protein
MLVKKPAECPKHDEDKASN